MKPAAARPLMLVLHGSADLYGSDKVLLSTMTALATDNDVPRPVVVLHERGPLVAALQAVGVEVHVADVGKISRAMFTPMGLLRLPAQLWRTGRVLGNLVAGRSVALVYSNTLAVLGGAVWAWRRGLPHLWHVHEMPSRPALVSHGLPRLASALSRQVVANSTKTRDWLVQQAPALAGRTTVVFNGLPGTPRVQPQAAAAMRAQLGAADRDVLVVLAGRINRMKGQDVLIDAAARLQREGRAGRLRFAIVGDTVRGDEARVAALKAQAAAAGVAERFVFMPFTEEIFAVWQAADIAVVPSTEPEAFGLVAIEAMACGKPVVASAQGGLLDVVADGVSGILVPPRDAAALADAIARLAGDEALRHRLGQAGAQRRAELFSLTSQVSGMRAACLATLQARRA